MRAVEALTRLGGVASPKELRRLTSRRQVRTALRQGTILAASRSRLVLPTAAEAHVAAA